MELENIVVNENIITDLGSKNFDVRVVANDGEQFGIMKLDNALNLAFEKELDLILISKSSMPPVCKILDYSKYMYDMKKKAKEQARKNRESIVEVKEIQLRPVTDTHDLLNKIRQTQKFLNDGNKVRVVVKFKGREVSHLDSGRTIIDRMLSELKEFKLERTPEQNGSSLVAVISPILKK